MIALLKKVTPLQQLVRRAPPYYPAARALLARFETKEPGERTALAHRLEAALVKAARAAPAYAELVTLSEAPLLTKAEVRAAPERWRARTLLPASIARTSGTSGASLEVVRSPAQVMFEQATLDWLVGKAGFDFARARVAVLRADTIKAPEDRNPPFWTLSADRRILTLSAHHLDALTLAGYVEAVAGFKPDILYAYPSAALNLATLCERAGADIAFPLALTSSEELPSQTRAKLARVFHARTVDYYGQAERVAFAWSTEPGRYAFHPGYGKVELLDQGAGPEIVGSCYHNRAQFLLRYRTGDHIVLGESADMAAIAAGEATFAGVSGRTSDVVYGADGEVFLGLNHIPRPFDQIDALQIVQTGPGEVHILVLSERDRSDALREKILAAARQKIGPAVKLDVTFTDALRKSAAGKTPFVIHDWKPATV